MNEKHTLQKNYGGNRDKLKKKMQVPAIYINTKWTTGEKSLPLICGQLNFDY